MEGVVNRYHQLLIQESLSQSYNYTSACQELASILKLSYSKFPKSLQSVVFQDVLTAFRLLPIMETPSAVSAANMLLQGVESALPKQKKTLAVTEFKHAMVAHKRSSKNRQREKDLVELPQDVLVHIFSFLDLHSLVSTSLVCRSWNVASSDNHLWKLMHTMVFNTIHDFSKINTELEKLEQSQESIACNSSLEWRTVIKKAYNGLSLKKLFTSSRGLCTHCHAIVWVRDMHNEATFTMKCKNHHIKPLSTSQIIEYIDGDYPSSDSDSDSEIFDAYFSRLWAYPRHGYCLHGELLILKIDGYDALNGGIMEGVVNRYHHRRIGFQESLPLKNLL